jgi:DNA-directed RNA polymerase subunit RPC12/RpoP
VDLNWANISKIDARSYVCGYCGKNVGPDKGYFSQVNPNLRIYVCSFCQKPTYFHGNEQTPGVAYGNEVDKLSDAVGALYRESRNCMAVSAYTAAILGCRKLLMHVAVEKGAPSNQPFVSYVEYLASNHYVPPGSGAWVDHIRKKGNEANHEITIMSKGDAEELITFVEMLLKLVYEFPGRVPKT